MRIAVIGGGSSYTPELVKGLLDISKDVRIDEVIFYDIDEEKQKIVVDFVKRLVKDRFKVLISDTFEGAVVDAKYVIFQFRPGGLKGRENDEGIPLKYGLIGQETTGVGGFSAALRAFPVIEEYVDTVRRTSNATIINFTNPSGHITEFVRNYLEYEKFIGLCNVPINFIREIAEIFSARLEDVFLKYYGLNHLSFIEKVFVKGEDVTEKVFENLKLKLSNIPDEDFPAWFYDSVELLVNPYLRYYLMEKKMFKKISTHELRAREVMKIEKELFEKYRTATEIPEELTKRGGSMYSTAAAHLIRDLETDEGKIHIVNTRNNGSIENLPDDYVLEIPCYVRSGRVHALSQGKGDHFALSFIHAVKMYERLTIEAYLKRSKKLALKALLSHPLGPDVEGAKDLLEEILEANREYVRLE
ncbi:6-phospho-beta-glucosidase BglT [Thermotoga sp. Mc24]|uniref:6-phospho-beta-glucosidase BglT n=1 Tax=Thermotoga sp. Mc24 TaxID=1231241 RepID=UPI000543B640|nr:6-phospho-beta-glucosidase BglT [Thermotoga sp. Mc24]KHC91436.1 6-phospho-beta-glucosidase BglT [Thermotoga sp. Mc24]